MMRDAAGEPSESIAMSIQNAAAVDESPGAGQVVYIIEHPHGFFKIGLSQHPLRRLDEIQGSTPYRIELIAFKGFRNAELAEEILHEYFSESHIRGEWFDIADELYPLLIDETRESLKTIVQRDSRYPGIEDS